jgi:hypothetical protein
MSIDPLAQRRLDWLAVNGICTSITYGPSEGAQGAPSIIWTVNCLSPRYLDFEKPLQAYNFDHAVEIAVLESIEQGFVEGPGP